MIKPKIISVLIFNNQPLTKSQVNYLAKKYLEDYTDYGEGVVKNSMLVPSSAPALFLLYGNKLDKDFVRGLKLAKFIHYAIANPVCSKWLSDEQLNIMVGGDLGIFLIVKYGFIDRLTLFNKTNLVGTMIRSDYNISLVKIFKDTTDRSLKQYIIEKVKSGWRSHEVQWFLEETVGL